MKNHFSLAGAWLLALLLLAACTKNDEQDYNSRSGDVTPLANANKKDNNAFAAHSWIDLQLQLIKADGNFIPPVASRTLGLTVFALYESIVGKLPQQRSIAA